ncbi:prepilin-type N-terminal cleavage/methylation domain-containing protein [Acidovorax sp. 62]|uniref:type II secretion system protein n=1 Tax=Acidovorax sp. 62 TaxID=2035203 RepID=UPI000C19A717|nr:type II secretion system protein [Acidovorax sp. 62]PIF91233.1 prepilin-type N-terminal cleavage/methylation domain-containing protein [Acidovorax sp. 62]
MKRSLRQDSGFSLVELAVVLAIVGIIGIFVWRWVVSTREPLQRPAMLRQLSEAQAAVEGFVLANHRLPCPATNSGGSEACSDATAVLLPWKSLGLSSTFGQLHYGVNRGGGVDLAVAPAASVSPDLNVDFTGMPVIPTYPSFSPPISASATVTAAAARATAAITAAGARRAVANGLDWCHVLRRFASNSAAAGILSAGNVSDSMPVAYVLIHPGENNQFDGNNAVGASATWRFDFPGRLQDTNYDDLTLAVGPSDLDARIGCVGRLSEMQATAQGAYAAYDSARVMQEYWSLRVYDITSAESAVQSAEAGVATAALGLALAIASGNISIASAANSEGLTTFTVGVAAANVIVAIAQTVLAGLALDDAKEALKVAKEKQAATDAYAAKVYDTFTQALTNATKLDVKGLNP